MGFHTNSIGGYEFDSMTGVIIPIAEEIEIWQRRGIDSIGARKIGKHGKPFQLTTVKYVADFDAARTGLLTYQDLQGNDPLTVIKQSVDWGAYLLISVIEAQDPQACYGVVGSLIADPQVRQVLRWTMHGG